jgi:hypothetical protein
MQPPDTANSSSPPLSIEAWYFKSIWVSAVVHGSLIVDESSVTMRDDRNLTIFSVSYQALKDVSLNSGKVKLRTTAGNYVVAVFDPRRTAGAQFLKGGVRGAGRTAHSSDQQAATIVQLIKSRLT